MSLLDSDAEIIGKIQEGKKNATEATPRKRRFSSLNRYASYTDDLREKTTDQSSDKKNTEIEELVLNTTSEDINLKTTREDAPPLKIEKDHDVIIQSKIEPIINPSLNSINKPQSVEHSTDTKIKPSKNNEYISSTKRVQQEYNEEYKSSTNRVHQEYETDNNTSTKAVQTGVPNGVQNIDCTPEVRTLSGQNKKLLDIFFNDCRKQGSLNTGKFLNENLSSMVGVKSSTLKTLVYRLSKAGYIERLPGRKGRGGWIQIHIPKIIYDQLLYLESSSTSSFISNEIEKKWSTEKVTQTSTSALSSSSNNLFNNNSTTTRTMPDDWNAIQIPQYLKENGFSMAHIRQLHSVGILTSDEVQDSLDNFAYDLTEGHVTAKSGPLRFFMGVLRKQKVPYISQSLIESEKRELEEYAKKIEIAKSSRKQQIEMSLIKKFEVWWNGLTQTQKNEVATPSQYAQEGSDMQENIARGLFLENPTLIEK